MKNIRPLAFAVDGHGPNPNVLNHKQAMEASDREQFELVMTEEMDNLVKNGIYEIVLRSSVSVQKSILRSVWSHRRKTRPDDEIYRYKSRIYANGSTQKYGIDYHETYSPVVMWSTIRTSYWEK